MTNDGQGAAAPRLNETLKAALEQRFGERFSVSHGVREHHGRDDSIYPLPLPEGVVFAESTEDVVDLVKLCRAHHCPIVPWGAGSSIEGQLLAIRGGITLDMSRMNRIVSVAAEDLLVTVQAGVTRKQLNQELHDTGLFFPIDPGRMPPSAAWPPPAPRAPTPCATAPCARTCWR